MQTLHPRLINLLNASIEHNASDIHCVVGKEPLLRVDGKLVVVAGESVLTPEATEEMIKPVISEEQVKRLKEQKDLDFSFGYGTVRYRANIYFEKGTVSLELRLIPMKIRRADELGLPPIVSRFINQGQGFVIVTGPTGHGKSTTLAALIDQMLGERFVNVLTLEDPIEYIFSHKKGSVSQRELGTDCTTFARGLRAALREDPDVVLIGEMRDLETIEAALTVAETGHLVFATLHANSAAQTADRIISIFPPHQQPQIRQQLAATLLGVVSQRLIPKIGGGRVLAAEVLLATSAVRSVIREGKTHQLDNIIATSASEGMISLDKVLAQLVTRGEITIDDALTYATDAKTFKLMVY